MSGSTVEIWDRLNATKIADGTVTVDGKVWGPKAASAKRNLVSPGKGELTLPDLHPSASSLNYRRVVRLLNEDGDVVMSWTVKEIDQIRTAESPQSKKHIDARGDSLLDRWNDAICVPWVEIGERPVSQTLVFNYASPGLDTSDWTNTVYSQPRSGADPVRPAGHPDPVSDWLHIYPEGDAGVMEMAIRKEFTLASETILAFYYTADDRMRTWFDGTELESEIPEFPADVWKFTHHAVIKAPAGDHVFAMLVKNDADISGMLASCWPSTDGLGLDLEPIWVTGTDSMNPFVGYFLAIDHTATPSGWKAGAILRSFLDKAHDRGCIPEVSLDCTDDLDSNGNPFVVIPEVSVRVGGTGGDLLKALEPYCEFEVDETQPGVVTKVYDKASGGKGGASRTLTSGVNVRYLATHGEANNVV